jgi:hypothetical protein
MKRFALFHLLKSLYSDTRMFERVSLSDQLWGLCSLFFLFNDIVADINSSIKSFADDISLYMIVDDPVAAAETFNTDLAKMHDWSMTWLCQINLFKGSSI